MNYERWELRSQGERLGDGEEHRRKKDEEEEEAKAKENEEKEARMRAQDEHGDRKVKRGTKGALEGLRGDEERGRSGGERWRRRKRTVRATFVTKR